MKYLIILILLSGCNAHVDNGKSSGSTSFERLENDEVLCYGYYQHSLQCKFK